MRVQVGRARIMRLLLSSIPFNHASTLHCMNVIVFFTVV